MRGKQSVGLSGVVLGAVLLSGCSAEADAPPPATASPSDTSNSTDATDDVATCTAFGDVLTILENADLGIRDGRMETQEQQGWYQLATRVLDRLPSSGDSAVSEAIADLQDVAPAIPSGAGIYADGIGSPEWISAQSALSDACLDVGVALMINVFTGG